MDLLPHKFHCHYLERARLFLLEAYTEKHEGTFWKMKLADRKKAALVKEIESKNFVRMNDSHADELVKMYRLAYPDGYFEPQMLRGGKFFGYVHNEQIVSCAGLHIDSEEYGVAALGSIATLPEFRGKGFATKVTARLLKEIVSNRETIMLNVSGENTPAVKCYTNLGFEKTHEYEEGLFTLGK